MRYKYVLEKKYSYTFMLLSFIIIVAVIKDA